MKLKPAAPEVLFASDSAVLMRIPGAVPSHAVSERIWAWSEALEKLRPQWPITNIHPAFCSVLVEFNPSLCDPAGFLEEVKQIIIQAGPTQAAAKDLIKVPVLYDGPDLPEVAKHSGLSITEIITLHSSVEYEVAFLGFAPGFPYLIGLPAPLNCPRKASPRLKVPAGSVAIAGEQTGIYPAESPGGWQVIGRTAMPLFEPRFARPTLLKAGDRVRFQPQANIAKFSKNPRAAGKPSGLPLLEVLSPGFFASIQDFGRDGWTQSGISPGGAADPVALESGNLLLGNFAGAAAIETTALGGEYRFLKDGWIALTGAPAPAHIDGKSMGLWRAHPVYGGQVLKIGAFEDKLRTYLCVRGGISVEPMLGSRSTYVSGGWGGFNGRGLIAGDLLLGGDQTQGLPSHRPCALVLRRLYGEDIAELRVTRGPQWDWFDQKSQRAFMAEEFHVTDEVNRLGSRLNGPALSYDETHRGRELTSEGIANGAIQIPAGGQALLLFCEQRTTGGYPKIASVIKADWFRMGQLQPGQRLRFREVSLDEARRFNADMELTLQAAWRGL